MKRLALSLLLLLNTLAYAGEKVLYSFQGGTDGMNPQAPLVADQAGSLFGTTFGGGNSGLGTIFELSPDGKGGWTESVLYSFTGGTDGQNPFAGMIFDSAGNLYGTTLGMSGECAPKCGSVFELSPSGKDWKFKILHTFQGGNDGGIIGTGVVMDTAGNLYGAANGFGPKGFGTVYELSPNGSGWKLKTLHAFAPGSGGGGPAGTLVIGSDGTLYGVTLFGGNGSNAGVFYGLSKNTKGMWKENVLYSFKGKNDGAQVTGLSSDQNGELCGVSNTGNRHLYLFHQEPTGQVE